MSESPHRGQDVSEAVIDLASPHDLLWWYFSIDSLLLSLVGSVWLVLRDLYSQVELTVYPTPCKQRLNHGNWGLQTGKPPFAFRLSRNSEWYSCEYSKLPCAWNPLPGKASNLKPAIEDLHKEKLLVIHFEEVHIRITINLSCKSKSDNIVCVCCGREYENTKPEADFSRLF